MREFISGLLWRVASGCLPEGVFLAGETGQLLIEVDSGEEPRGFASLALLVQENTPPGLGSVGHLLVRNEPKFGRSTVMQVDGDAHKHDAVTLRLLVGAVKDTHFNPFLQGE